QKRAEQQRVVGTKPSLSLDKYVGTYADSLFGTRTVTLESGALRMRFGPRDAATLEHWQYDTFRARFDNRWDGTQLVTFTIGADATPSRVEMGGATYRRVTQPGARATGYE